MGGGGGVSFFSPIPLVNWLKHFPVLTHGIKQVTRFKQAGPRVACLRNINRNQRRV